MNAATREPTIDDAIATIREVLGRREVGETWEIVAAPGAAVECVLIRFHDTAVTLGVERYGDGWRRITGHAEEFADLVMDSLRRAQERKARHAVPAITFTVGDKAEDTKKDG